VYAAIVGNGYGQFDPIPQDLGRAPGPEGLGHLRQRLETLRARVTSNGQAKTHRDGTFGPAAMWCASWIKASATPTGC
jgi:hypothetical protein